MISRGAYQLSSSVTNATGDGNPYMMIANQKRYDFANDYNPSTGILTARYSGVYEVSFQANVSNITSGHYNGWCAIKNLNQLQDWCFQDCNPYAGRSAPSLEGTFNFGGNALIDVTAGDQIQIMIMMNYSTKTITIMGDSNNPITFICFNYVGPKA